VLITEAPAVWRAVERYARDVMQAQKQELEAAAEEKRSLKVYWADLDAPKVRRSLGAIPLPCHRPALTLS
jgi:hypothetical protein